MRGIHSFVLCARGAEQDGGGGHHEREVGAHDGRQVLGEDLYLGHISNLRAASFSDPGMISPIKTGCMQTVF